LIYSTHTDTQTTLSQDSAALVYYVGSPV